MKRQRSGLEVLGRAYARDARASAFKKGFLVFAGLSVLGAGVYLASDFKGGDGLINTPDQDRPGTEAPLDPTAAPADPPEQEPEEGVAPQQEPLPAEGPQMSGADAQAEVRSALGEAGLDTPAGDNFVELSGPDGVDGAIAAAQEGIAGNYPIPALSRAVAACGVLAEVQNPGDVSVAAVEVIRQGSSGDVGVMADGCTQGAREAWVPGALYPQTLQIG